MNTYVPINFSELYRIGAAQKQSVDETANTFRTQLQTLGEFQSPSTIDMQNYYNEGIAKFNNLINEAVANPDAMKDPTFLVRLNSTINNLDYRKLSQLKAGAKNLEARQAMKAKLIAEDRYKSSWDVYRDAKGQLRQFDASNYDTLNEGVLEDLSPRRYSSMFEIVNPYVKDLKPSFIAGSVNPITGQKMSFVKGYNAITEKDISDILDRSMNEILMSDAGQLWYRDIANATRMQNPGATNEDIMSNLRDNMMRDARYKLTATPVDDTFAMQMALQSAKLKYTEAAKGKQSSSVLGIEDYLNNIYSNKLKDVRDYARNSSNWLAKEYDAKYEAVSNKMMSFLDNLQNTNQEFRQQYQKFIDTYAKSGVDPNSPELVQSAYDYAVKNSNLSKEQKAAYNAILQEGAKTNQDEIADSQGVLMQQAFNDRLAVAPQANPFKSIDYSTELKSGNVYYGESKVHQAFQDCLNVLTQPLGESSGLLLDGLFKNDKQISPSIGYSVNPRELLSAKTLVAQNKYMKQLANEADVDLNSLTLHRGSWWPTSQDDKNFEIEERVAKGDFGTVAINKINGYINTPEERAYNVSVNVPLKGLTDKYNRWWSVDDVEGTLRKNGFVVTGGSGDDKDGIWKDGYITIDMVLPVTNTKLDKTVTNRAWQKEQGVTGTREAQIAQDDAFYRLMGFDINSGL